MFFERGGNLSFQNIFKRYELKYLITEEQYEKLREVMAEYMRGDRYGRSTICNLYYDTPDYLLIRRSIEKPVFKEKLRVRSYGVASEDSTTFIELKRKYDKVVYKRRITSTDSKAFDFLVGRENNCEGQIAKEINYFLDFYKNLSPKVFLSYEREAFYGLDNHDFRVTFDRNILWRDYDLSLCKGVYGKEILKSGEVLMEVKVATAIPLWLVRFLSENKIYKTSFSKYGNAYKTILNDKITGGLCYAEQ